MRREFGRKRDCFAAAVAAAASAGARLKEFLPLAQFLPDEPRASGRELLLLDHRSRDARQRFRLPPYRDAAGGDPWSWGPWSTLPSRWRYREFPRGACCFLHPSIRGGAASHYPRSNPSDPARQPAQSAFAAFLPPPLSAPPAPGRALRFFPGEVVSNHS